MGETPEGRKSCQVSSATSSSSSTTTTVEDKEEATKKEEEVVVEDQGKEPEASKKATTPSDDEKSGRLSLTRRTRRMTIKDLRILIYQKPNLRKQPLNHLQPQLLQWRITQTPGSRLLCRP